MASGSQPLQGPLSKRLSGTGSNSSSLYPFFWIGASLDGSFYISETGIWLCAGLPEPAAAVGSIPVFHIVCVFLFLSLKSTSVSALPDGASHTIGEDRRCIRVNPLRIAQQIWIYQYIPRPASVNVCVFVSLQLHPEGTDGQTTVGRRWRPTKNKQPRLYRLHLYGI